MYQPLENLKTLLSGKKKDKRKEQQEEEEQAGNVSMNEGDHGTIFGFNRNIIIGVGVGIFTITAIATIFALDEPEVNENPNPQRTQQASTKRDGEGQTKALAGGYEDLVKADSRFGQPRENQQQGRGQGTPPKHQESRVPVQTPPPVTAPPASIPQIPQQVQVVAPAPQPARDEAAEAYAQRMRSAIAFSVPGLRQNGNAAQSSTGNNAQSLPAGELEQDAPDSANIASAPATVQAAPMTVAYTKPGPYTLQAGTIIPVVLCTGINSDIGGQVVAQVQQDMFDSATGRHLLIPAGSRLLGTYGKGSPNNSGRVELTFNTIVLPNGGSYSVNGCMVAVDGAGYAGVSGKVHRHTGQVVSAGVFSSALAALGSVAAGNVSNTSNTYSAGQLAMQGAMANMMNTASQLFQQGANRQMTVTAAPGKMFSVYITQSITLRR